MNDRDKSTTLAELAQVAGHLEQMWEQLLGGQPGAPGTLPYAPHAFRPPADVYETADNVIVVLEIAGILGQEVDVHLEARRLTVRGVRRDRRASDRRRYSSMEIPFGPFERTIVLPADVDGDGALARYADGLLEIALPRRPRPTARRLRIALA